MADDDILKLLKGITIFKVLTPGELKALAKMKTVLIKYDADEAIIQQGDIDLRLFVLLKGKAVVNKNENPGRILATLKPGDVFGEVSFISQSPRTANVIARKPVYALRMDGDTFDALDLAIQNKIRAELIKLLVLRLNNLNDSIVMSEAMLSYLRYNT
ncbi:MAG: hypothetical protein COV67_00915 [Nitrospinae bacterium CG11_big_fil_rev_8_21_14_0_20_56_8]|nr:MAG: hypothetical protein COV67_00915 [Nitrospinae bacterium CG11_big_fil_rev_8_21_14_0_20_56_8]